MEKRLRVCLKILLVMVSLCIINGTSVVASANHRIISRGHSYTSKYTVKQMRRRYHLRYRIVRHHKWAATYNHYEGIVKGGHTGHWINGGWKSGHHLKGRYAQFISNPAGEGMVATVHYVSLKSGKMYTAHTD
ncbi:hypothetical protein [Levilactobacillus namurensis]|uniref:hypothetical protein n=1 Tax=Levilactobacillus namurensis TaxID=380393 RepID=UPI001DE3CEC7|nr:hypothetical protein [Levilactobacillus namurensis]HJE45504.1 hypothetical protein [Levilactobacillus namurensis]